MNEILSANFIKRFDGGVSVSAENFVIPAGAGTTVLFGASGSGKTTVLRCLAGLEKLDEGDIRVKGEVWSDASRKLHISPRLRHVGFVPQDYALFPHLNVEHNVGYGLHSMSGGERRARVIETMRLLGIEELGQRRPKELSGGQQQRVALARALVCRPRLLLLDEPLSALDLPTRQRLRGELRQLLVEAGITVILVTHDRLEALALGDRLVVMDEGRILQQGPVHDVFSRPANLSVASIVGVDTVEPARITNITDGLATLQVGAAWLTAFDRDVPPGTRDAYVCIRAEDVMLSNASDSSTSSRNRLPALVRAMSSEGPMVRLTLDCGFPLTALLTRQACEALSLHENAHVFALIKAPQIHIIPR